MTKIKLIRTAPISTTGRLEEPGWSGEVPEGEADGLVRLGKAVLAGGEPPQASKTKAKATDAELAS